MGSGGSLKCTGTEAVKRTGPTLHGVLPSLAGGEFHGRSCSAAGFWQPQLPLLLVSKSKSNQNYLLLLLNRRIYVPPTMDQITIKTPNPKCRLYWCVIEFIYRLAIQSVMLLFSTSLTFSLVHLPPFLCE